MRILQLCTYDQGGGAERIALDMHRAYRALGHDARLLVRHKFTATPGVVEIDAYAHTSPWAGLCAMLERQVADRPKFRGQYRLRDWLRRTAWPQRWIDGLRGADDFNYPYADHLLDNPDWQPDAIHAHNLHGDFFDLRAMAMLSRRIPVVWTLHDTWALAGHCGYFEDINCERWRTGCGNCPDLQRPPAIRRDRTAENWQRKRQIYALSQLAVATPSRWLMRYVEQSILQPWQQRIIPYGLDRSVYRPGDRREARAALGLPQDAFIAMAIAYNTSTHNPYKDFTTVNQVIAATLARQTGRDLMFVCIGRNDQPAADPRVRYTGYIADTRQIARYYQAADVMLHATRVDNFPVVILEALACGAPVVATAVGGIPEQITPGATGFLTPRGDSAAMTQTLIDLMDNPDRLAHLRQNVSAQAHATVSQEQQANAYLAWLDELQAAYTARFMCHS